MFLEGLKQHQKQWKLIAEMVKTRTVVQIRTHAQKYFQKLTKSNGGSWSKFDKSEDLQVMPRSPRLCSNLITLTELLSTFYAGPRRAHVRQSQLYLPRRLVLQQRGQH